MRPLIADRKNRSIGTIQQTLTRTKEPLAVTAGLSNSGFSASRKFSAFNYLCAGRQFCAFYSATAQARKTLPAIMKKRIATIVFGLTGLTLTAQTKDKKIFLGNIISDTSTFKNSNYRTPLTSILKSKNKIEIRFITNPSFEYTSYTILTFNKKWTAKHFYYTPDKDSILSKDINKKANIDTVFSRLVSNNIFSLPDQDSLKTGKYSYDLETNELIGSIISVCDGTCYFIEFKVGDLYRRYSYCNPDSYADFYPSVYELRNFTNIVDTFNELTKE